MDELGALVAQLPKVELHVHLVGSAPVPTVLELARRHPDSRVPRTEEKLREFYAFRDFPHFVDLYEMVTHLLTEPEDITDPTSNVCTGQIAALEEHPLPRMLEAGLNVTLNSDDPPMFSTTPSNEYLVAARVLGLPPAQLAALAANAVRASFLDDEAKAELLAEIAQVSEDAGPAQPVS